MSDSWVALKSFPTVTSVISCTVPLRLWWKVWLHLLFQCKASWRILQYTVRPLSASLLDISCLWALVHFVPLRLLCQNRSKRPCAELFCTWNGGYVNRILLLFCLSPTVVSHLIDYSKRSGLWPMRWGWDACILHLSDLMPVTCTLGAHREATARLF